MAVHLFTLEFRQSRNSCSITEHVNTQAGIDEEALHAAIQNDHEPLVQVPTERGYGDHKAAPTSSSGSSISKTQQTKTSKLGFVVFEHSVQDQLLAAASQR